MTRPARRCGPPSKATAYPSANPGCSSGVHEGGGPVMSTDRGDVPYLLRFSWTEIVRHQMVQTTASADDPDLTDYSAARRRRVKPPIGQLHGAPARPAARTLSTVWGSPTHRRPATAVPKRMGALVAGRHPQSRPTRLPSPQWTTERARHAGRRPNPSDLCTLPASRGHGHATAARPAHHPHRPRWLLEPDARKAGPSGSEGALAQQCAGATRQAHLARGLRETLLDPVPGGRDPAQRTQRRSGGNPVPVRCPGDIALSSRGDAVGCTDGQPVRHSPAIQPPRQRRLTAEGLADRHPWRRANAAVEDSLDHPQGEFRLRRVAHSWRYPEPPARLGTGGPRRRQVQLPVDQRPAARRRVPEEH